ncbi:hypothetical protein ACFDTO_07320 [Microbacteriaceae bacterium 4G12]
MKRHSKMTLGASALALVIAASVAPSAAQANDDRSGSKRDVTLHAELTELNGSGASGTARAEIRRERIKTIEIHAEGLTPNAPHAQHIHYGEQALNECPTLALDSNGDGRLNTVEGVPAYGPVVLSLTTKGDTSPASFLDVSRMPVSVNGEYHYRENNLRFTAVAGTGYPGADGTGTAKQIAEAVRDGEGVVVIHGQDYDGNGSYNFSNPEGASELDPTLPAEATDPVACGVLK